MKRSLLIAVFALAGACTARALFPAGGDTSSKPDGGSHDGGTTHDGDGGPIDTNGDGSTFPLGDGFTTGNDDGGTGIPVDMAMPFPPPSQRGAKVGTGVWLVTADLNHDGLGDLVVLQGNGTIRIYLGQKAGTLFTGQSFELNTNTSATMLVLADVDGDGLPDLVTAEPGHNEVDVHRANTDGATFGDFARLPVAGTVQSVAVGDLDNDGAPEIVALSLDGNLRVFQGQKGSKPLATINVFPGTMGAQQVKLADMNQDGKLDAVTVDSGGTITTLLGDGKLGFGGPSTVAGTPMGSRLVIGDWTDDGFPDIVALGVQNKLIDIAPNLATNLAATTTGGLAVAPMTGNGVADYVITGDATVSMQIISTDPVNDNSVKTPFVVLDEPASFIAIADFDGNGRLDVAAAGPTKTQLYLTPSN